jgi:DNA-binding transcriptional regulator YhcF (GntR family)
MSDDLTPPPEWDPDDPRVLFRRVVDDILTQINQGKLHPNAPLPSARKMADLYGVGVMTIQRALRELQNLRVTYSVAGKGTFVHPDAFDTLRGAALREPIDDPDLRRRVADYLAHQQRIVHRLNTTHDPDDRNDALADLLAHADKHKDLIDEATKYQSDRGNFAKDPFAERRQAKPAPRKRAPRARNTDK